MKFLKKYIKFYWRLGRDITTQFIVIPTIAFVRQSDGDSYTVIAWLFMEIFIDLKGVSK